MSTTNHSFSKWSCVLWLVTHLRKTSGNSNICLIIATRPKEPGWLKICCQNFRVEQYVSIIMFIWQFIGFFSIFFLEMALKTQIPDHHCHQQIGRLYQMMASFCHVGPLRLFEAVCYVFPFGPHTGLKLNVFSMDWAFPWCY